MEQGLKKLKAKKEKKKNSIKAKSLGTLVAYLSPLADFFSYNLFFLILLNIIYNNTPVLFL